MDRLKTHFGIDVYAEPILPKHFQYYQSGSTACLLMRHDMDNMEKARLLSEFLEIDELKVENFNQSIRHVYGAKYREFKQKLRLPPDYLQSMSSSKYYRHFYTEKEIEEQCDRWK
jgi:hypothetical protein